MRQEKQRQWKQHQMSDCRLLGANFWRYLTWNAHLIRGDHCTLEELVKTKLTHQLSQSGKLGRLIYFSVYLTTTDFFNCTLLEFCPKVAGKIGNLSDIGSAQQEIYLVNYFFTDFLDVKFLCCT